MTTAEPAQGITGASEIASAATEAPTQGDPTPDRTEPPKQPGKFRQRLADAESERDGLRATVQGLQRAEVERIAAQAELAVPSAIWAAGIELTDLLGDDGRVDAEKVNNAVAAAVTTLGLATRLRNPLPDMSQGARSDAMPIGAKDHPWSDLLKGGGSTPF